MMYSFGLGDLAQSFMLQRHGAALKVEMGTLNRELATGQVSDVRSVLAGNVSYLSDIERDLKTLDGFRVAAAEARQFTDSVQEALTRIGGSIETVSTSLINMASSVVGPVLDQLSRDAEVEFSAMVSALNTSSGGRALFSGAATDQNALTDSADILAGLRAATAGASTPQDIMAAATAWFDDPAGFSAQAYNGSNTAISPFRVAEGETVSVQLTAEDQVLRDALRNMAVAAIAADPGFGLGAEGQRALLTESGNGLFKSQSALTATRANVGSAQARIEILTTRNETENTSLQIAKGALLRADPYETATELEAVQFQLQSLYAITARMSDMSFVNFIR